MLRSTALFRQARGWHRIALAVDGSAGSLAAVHEAAEVARRQRARLTLVFIARRPPAYAALAPVSLSAIEADLLADANARLHAMVTCVPWDVPCTTLLRRGSVTAELARILHEDRHDVVLVALRRRAMMHVAALRWAAQLARRPGPEVVFMPSARDALADQRILPAAEGSDGNDGLGTLLPAN
jgi:hypothetical protein